MSGIGDRFRSLFGYTPAPTGTDTTKNQAEIDKSKEQAKPQPDATPDQKELKNKELEMGADLVKSRLPKTKEIKDMTLEELKPELEKTQSELKTYRDSLNKRFDTENGTKKTELSECSQQLSEKETQLNTKMSELKNKIDEVETQINENNEKLKVYSDTIKQHDETLKKPQPELKRHKESREMNREFMNSLGEGLSEGNKTRNLGEDEFLQKKGALEKEITYYESKLKEYTSPGKSSIVFKEKIEDATDALSGRRKDLDKLNTHRGYTLAKEKDLELEKLIKKFEQPIEIAKKGKEHFEGLLKTLKPETEKLQEKFDEASKDYEALVSYDPKKPQELVTLKPFSVQIAEDKEKIIKDKDKNSVTVLKHNISSLQEKKEPLEKTKKFLSDQIYKLELREERLLKHQTKLLKNAS